MFLQHDIFATVYIFPYRSIGRKIFACIKNANQPHSQNLSNFMDENISKILGWGSENLELARGPSLKRKKYTNPTLGMLGLWHR